MSHLVVALAGGVIVLAAGGLGVGLAFGIATDDLGAAPSLVAESLAYAPAMWVLVALAVAAFGVVPRAVTAAWGTLAISFVTGFFGELLDLPQWFADVSPFTHVPLLPVADLTLTPLVVLTAIAAALVAVGLRGFRTRDVG